MAQMAEPDGAVAVVVAQVQSALHLHLYLARNLKQGTVVTEFQIQLPEQPLPMAVVVAVEVAEIFIPTVQQRFVRAVQHKQEMVAVVVVVPVEFALTLAQLEQQILEAVEVEAVCITSPEFQIQMVLQEPVDPV
jgi:hypothetical protein